MCKRDGPGPAETIVWWSFTRDAAPAPTRLRLSYAERHGLARLGVAPPELGRLMVGEATRWRRPPEQAARQLGLGPSLIPLSHCRRANQGTPRWAPHH